MCADSSFFFFAESERKIACLFFFSFKEIFSFFCLLVQTTCCWNDLFKLVVVIVTVVAPIAIGKACLLSWDKKVAQMKEQKNLRIYFLVGRQYILYWHLRRRKNQRVSSPNQSTSSLPHFFFFFFSLGKFWNWRANLCCDVMGTNDFYVEASTKFYTKVQPTDNVQRSVHDKSLSTRKEFIWRDPIDVQLRRPNHWNLWIFQDSSNHIESRHVWR